MRRFLKITIFSLLALAALYVIARNIRHPLLSGEFYSLENSHFRIQYTGISEDEAGKVLTALEKTYGPVRNILHDPDHSLIEVFIYPTREMFQARTGISGSAVTGTSRGPTAFHMLYTDWLNSFLPTDPEQIAVHEFVHCVQLNILIEQFRANTTVTEDPEFSEAFEQRFTEYPQWLWESVSTYYAGEENVISIRYAAGHGQSLEELSTDNDIYLLGYTVIAYVKEQWGEEKVGELIRNYGDTERVLDVTQENFETGWKKYVDENY